MAQLAGQPREPGGQKQRAGGEAQGAPRPSCQIGCQVGGSDGDKQLGQRVYPFLPDEVEQQSVVDHGQPLPSGGGLEAAEGAGPPEPHAGNAERDAVLCPEQHVDDDEKVGGLLPGGRVAARQGAPFDGGNNICVYAGPRSLCSQLWIASLVLSREWGNGSL